MISSDSLNDYYDNRIQWLEEIGEAGIRDFTNKTCGLCDDGTRLFLNVKTNAGNSVKYNILQDVLFCIKQYDLEEKDFINCMKSTIPEYQLPRT